jgi:PEP-CTERM motif
MRKRFRNLSLRAVAVLGVAAGLAAPTDAAIYEITYSGTVSLSNDLTGLFGGSGSSLDGSTYLAVYTLDDALPGAGYNNDGFQRLDYGGSFLSAPSPVSATLTINGITKSIMGTYVGTAYLWNESTAPGLLGSDLVANQAYDIFTAGNHSDTAYIVNQIVSLASNEIVTSLNYSDLVNYVVQSNDLLVYSAGYFSFQISDVISGQTIYSQNTIGVLSLGAVRFATHSAPAPEPASVALLGIGVMGVGVCRRKR